MCQGGGSLGWSAGYQVGVEVSWLGLMALCMSIRSPGPGWRVNCLGWWAPSWGRGFAAGTEDFWPGWKVNGSGRNVTRLQQKGSWVGWSAPAWGGGHWARVPGSWLDSGHTGVEDLGLGGEARLYWRVLGQ